MYRNIDGSLENNLKIQKRDERTAKIPEDEVCRKIVCEKKLIRKKRNVSENVIPENGKAYPENATSIESHLDKGNIYPENVLSLEDEKQVNDKDKNKSGSNFYPENELSAEADRNNNSAKNEIYPENPTSPEADILENAGRGRPEFEWQFPENEMEENEFTGATGKLVLVIKSA